MLYANSISLRVLKIVSISTRRMDFIINNIELKAVALYLSWDIAEKKISLKVNHRESA